MAWSSHTVNVLYFEKLTLKGTVHKIRNQAKVGLKRPQGLLTVNSQRTIFIVDLAGKSGRNISDFFKVSHENLEGSKKKRYQSRGLPLRMCQQGVFIFSIRLLL